jgi:transglutaminase-like putative cysteine protease
MNMTNPWKKLRALVFAMACTLVCGSTTLAARVDARAVVVRATSATSAQEVRPRFIAPRSRGERLPHASAESFRSAVYLPPAPLAKRAGKGVAKDAAVDAFAPPGPADLGENDDVVLTPAIRSLSDSLGHNPVQIYNWVRDHVAFTPTWGSIQGADATLQTRRGNAYDTASLLVA